jgi:mannosyltransferase OCH1-like enzyme
MIPKIIHQVWINDTFLGNPKKDVPDKWKKSINQWKTLHPDWQHILWTDDLILNYLTTYHPDKLNLYKSYEYLIQRADMIRYFILYDYGGIYCDLDMYPVKNLNSFINININQFVYSSNSNVLTNCFMMSPPKSKIMKTIQENLNTELPWFSYGKHLKVLYSTGPMFLNNILLSQIDEPFIILPRKFFNPYSIVKEKLITEEKDLSNIHINYITNETGSWNEIDTHVYNFVSKYNLFFITIGILSIIFIFIFLVYYMTKYQICRESKDKCEKTCNK